jgi:hypothetical protein
MLRVVAPLATAAASASKRKASSLRVASSGENSTSRQRPARVGHHGRDALERLGAREAQLVLEVDVGCRQEGVDARPPGAAHRLPGGVDVAARRAGQAADDGLAVADLRRDGLSPAARSSGEAAGKPASITSTPEADQRARHLQLLGRGHDAPGDCSPSRRVVSKIRTRSPHLITWA